MQPTDKLIVCGKEYPWPWELPSLPIVEGEIPTVESPFEGAFTPFPHGRPKLSRHEARVARQKRLAIIAANEAGTPPPEETADQAVQASADVRSAGRTKKLDGIPLLDSSDDEEDDTEIDESPSCISESPAAARQRTDHFWSVPPSSPDTSLVPIRRPQALRRPANSAVRQGKTVATPTDSSQETSEEDMLLLPAPRPRKSAMERRLGNASNHASAGNPTMDDNTVTVRCTPPRTERPLKRSLDDMQDDYVETSYGMKPIVKKRAGARLERLIERGKTHNRVWYPCKYVGDSIANGDVIHQTELKTTRHSTELVKQWEKDARADGRL